ncbi:MAG: lysophospholipase [Anaerolineae bacterium]|nr:lysophospholipase [Anaerolineae bacterium]
MPNIPCYTSDGLTLHTEHALPEGDPKAIVLLVHGYGEHSGRYAHVVARLVNAGYAVYTLDHRGHGKSEGVRAYCDYMGQFVDDLKQYFDQITAAQPDKPVFVVGHSMGALISLAFTLRYQSQIAGLVISGAPVIPDADVSRALVLVGTILNRITPKLHLLGDGGKGLLSSDPQIDILWDQDPLTNKKPMRVRLGVEINNMARDVRAHLGDLRLPMLILHGADDKRVNPVGSQYAYDHASSPDRTLKLYPTMRHEIMNEIGKEGVLDEIVAWLDAHVDSRAIHPQAERETDGDRT